MAFLKHGDSQPISIIQESTEINPAEVSEKIEHLKQAIEESDSSVEKLQTAKDLNVS